MSARESPRALALCALRGEPGLQGCTECGNAPCCCRRCCCMFSTQRLNAHALGQPAPSCTAALTDVPVVCAPIAGGRSSCVPHAKWTAMSCRVGALVWSFCSSIWCAHDTRKTCFSSQRRPWLVVQGNIYLLITDHPAFAAFGLQEGARLAPAWQALEAGRRRHLRLHLLLLLRLRLEVPLPSDRQQRQARQR